jgi:hypothetical protein
MAPGGVVDQVHVRAAAGEDLADDLLDLMGVADHDRDDVAALGELHRVGAPGRAALDELGGPRLRPGVHRQRVAGLEHVAGHGATHDAEADPADAGA